MANKYKLSEDELKKIRIQDQKCVYCHKLFKESRGVSYRDKATIEHLNHLPPWNNPKTVAYCCRSCNSSRGKKELAKWFKTNYCLDKKINGETVAQPVKNYIRYSER